MMHLNLLSIQHFVSCFQVLKEISIHLQLGRSLGGVGLAGGAGGWGGAAVPEGGKLLAAVPAPSTHTPAPPL